MKKLIVFLTTCTIALLCFIFINLPAGNPVENRATPLVVLRVDDVQDYAFKEAQLFLLSESIKDEIPLSLAVIAGYFGEDTELVEQVKLAISSGSEATVHGWEHEDLAQHSLEEQIRILSDSKKCIQEKLNYDTQILIPPMFSYNEDTLKAMQKENYNLLSTCADLSSPGYTSNVLNIPATIELSDYANEIWDMKNYQDVEVEVSRSITKYNYAIIVTHPQEFITDGELDQANVETYKSLLKTMKNSYSFTTLKNLSEYWISLNR